MYLDVRWACRKSHRVAIRNTKISGVSVLHSQVVDEPVQNRKAGRMREIKWSLAIWNIDTIVAKAKELFFSEQMENGVIRILWMRFQAF